MVHQERPASPLALTLFGPFEVRLHGSPLPRPRSQKTHWLLALLALQEGRALERTWLGGTLWPDSSEEQAAHNLRNSLWFLRQALGPEARRLETPTTQTLRLDLVDAEADLLIFDEAITRGDAASLEQAVALHRGPLLQGCEEEWVLQEREAREQAYLAALETLAAQAMAREAHADAVHTLRRLIAADPLRDTAQRALMQALAAAGDVAAATQVYRDFRLLLHHELNAAPDAETTARYEQIRADARARLPGPEGRRQKAVGSRDGTCAERPAPQPSELPTAYCLLPTGPGAVDAPGRIPRPLGRLVGRENEAREVCARLTEAPLVTLTGPGGIGKTRLAIRVAEECREPFADGICFVELAGLADGALVPPAVAAALGVREQQGHTLTVTLQEALSPRQLLLVLDNCEHLAEACAPLAEGLLGASPRLRILATSRQHLGLTGETTWPVPPLSLPEAPEGRRQKAEGSPTGPKPDCLLPSAFCLLDSEAVQLFVERATAAAPAFGLTESNAAAVARLCRRLEGIPLAIELAAARVRALSVEQITSRLDDGLRLLTGGSRTAPRRQQTLRATLDWSYDLLSEPERALLRRLAVFAGGFTLQAAEAVCSDFGFRISDFGFEENDDPPMDASARPQIRNPKSEIRNPEVLDLLTALVDQSLVQYAEQEGEGRYRLLETTREYALARLEEAGETERLRQRHLDWYLQMALESRSEPEEQDWTRRLEANHANLRAALAWALSADREVALRLGSALKRFWFLRGHITEGREWLDRILRADTGPPDGRTTADAAVPLRALRASALRAEGDLALSQGDHAAARAACEEALQIYRELDEVAGVGGCLSSLTAVCRFQGDNDAETRFAEEALRIHRELGQRGIEAIDLINLGLAAARRGEYNSARRWHTESLEICRELGAPFGEVYALHCLGSVAQREGTFDEAQRKLEESLRLARKIDDRRGIANALRQLVQLACDRGDTTATQALVEECQTLLRGLEDRLNIALLLIQQGRFAARQACWAEARQRLGEAARLLQRLRDRTENSAVLLEAFADLAAREGALHRAVRLYGGSEAIWEAMAAPRPAAERAAFECHMAAAHAALDEPDFKAAWEEGRAMRIEEAVAYALEG